MERYTPNIPTKIEYTRPNCSCGGGRRSHFTQSGIGHDVETGTKGGGSFSCGKWRRISLKIDPRKD
jgi:hypothetical protein